jgi:predicted Fe-Mo cluster-binding NifX family protein
MLFVDTDGDRREVTGRTVEKTPAHVPGLLPQWLKERQVNVVLAGGIGARAQELLAAASIQVLTGVSVADPEAAVSGFLDGTLKSGGYECDHSGGACHH